MILARKKSKRYRMIRQGYNHFNSNNAFSYQKTDTKRNPWVAIY